jgi:hypothetical protein
MRDARATQISRYLRAGRMSNDACRLLAYAIEQLESRGELEIFITEEIDRSVLGEPNP